MNAESTRKTASGATHHVSRRRVRPNPRDATVKESLPIGGQYDTDRVARIATARAALPQADLGGAQVSDLVSQVGAFSS